MLPETARCPVCRCDLEETFISCPSCETPHHHDCWQYAGGCARYGCSGGVTVEAVPATTALPVEDEWTHIEWQARCWSGLSSLHWGSLAVGPVGLLSLLTLALMAIFLLLATQFRSYAQPIIIMMAIPFGLIGAIAGHLVLGQAFTIISIFGIVALSGIVVNDSLILIDFTNRAHRGGMAVTEAVMQSGRSRFRPVLLTSVTTIAGLFPLLLERSFQAQILIPMAVSISFGLLAATLLTLLYVPALYLIVDDVIRAVKRRVGMGPEEDAMDKDQASS